MFVPILVYHQVQPKISAGITRVTPGQFQAQIEYLVDSGYQTLTVSEYVAQKDVLKGRYVVITFDDAYQCVYDYAYPILKLYGYRATIFVISSYVGRWNRWDYNFLNHRFLHCTWSQLKELTEAGWEVGSHSMTHRSLTDLPEHELWQELKHSKDQIEESLQRPVISFSYPFGKFNQKLVECAIEAGYSAGCTMGRRPWAYHEFPYALSRRAVYCVDPFPLFKAKLEENSWSSADSLKQRIVNFFAGGTVLYKRLRSS